MHFVTRVIPPFLGAFLMALACGSAHADPAPPAAAPAAAQPAMAGAAPTAAKVSPNDKVICKTEVPIGSRLGGHRVCMKKSDWDAQTQEARHNVEFSPPAGGH